MYAKDSLGQAPSMTTVGNVSVRASEADCRASESTIRAVPTVPVLTDTGFYLRFGKRFIDIVVSLTAILLLLPIAPIIACLIRFDSSGPCLYRCTRIGRGGKPFTFWKLRSMVRDADNSKQNLLHLNEVSGPVFKVACDPRVTRIGRFLRRSSLDEVPQLVHVLRGDMTLVGPRPPEPQEVLEYAPEELRRLSVRPGLTCLWQISGRSLIGFDEWMKLDLEYISNRSFMLDLKILLKTIPAVLSGKGAY
jgi:lipopolysaccharide/colanic/teichoic acid biosynthesis glycosyltransferase